MYETCSTELQKAVVVTPPSLSLYIRRDTKSENDMIEPKNRVYSVLLTRVQTKSLYFGLVEPQILEDDWNLISGWTLIIAKMFTMLIHVASIQHFHWGQNCGNLEHGKITVMNESHGLCTSAISFI